MRVPVVLLTGVHPDALATTVVGLQFDLPHAVVVRHRLDPGRQVLERIVSDLTGIVEHEVIELEHACVSCALREDVLPTLERVARDPRWRTVIAHLPIGAQATQVCAVLARDTRLARYLRVASVVTALDGPDLADDLLGDTLLADRELHSAREDRRGVGEVAGAMIEYADVVTLNGPVAPSDLDLVRTLARPGAHVVTDTADLDPLLVTGQLHSHGRTHAWIDPAGTDTTSAPASASVWTADLRSTRAFHPGRLLDGLDALGSGRHRSRGCFWLPTRPHRLLVWDGAGGQLSVGDGGPWAGRSPRTRILLTGLGTAPVHLQAAFDAMLLTEQERGSTSWQVTDDGFEPWLGEIRDVA